MFRMRETVRSKGGYYRAMAEALDRLPGSSGAPFLSTAIRALNDLILKARALKLTRLQHVLFLLADMMTWAEVGAALCEKSSRYEEGERSKDFMEAASRLFAREVVEKVYLDGIKIACGCGKIMEDMAEKMDSMRLREAMSGYLGDMDRVAAELVK
jgi:hypothetical protein